MDIVEFDVKNIGKFKAKTSLTIIEETQLESHIDELMNGKYYETKARAKSLAESHKEVADEIYMLIYVMQIIATLEFVVIEKPASILSFRDLKDYSTLFNIYQEYKKKVDALTTERQNSLNF